MSYKKCRKVYMILSVSTVAFAKRANCGGFSQWETECLQVKVLLFRRLLTAVLLRRVTGWCQRQTFNNRMVLESVECQRNSYGCNSFLTSLFPPALWAKKNTVKPQSSLSFIWLYCEGKSNLKVDGLKHQKNASGSYHAHHNWRGKDYKKKVLMVWRNCPFLVNLCPL